MSTIRARAWNTGGWIEVDCRGPMIDRVVDVDGPAGFEVSDEWVAPAFWDIQTNGRWGISYSAPDLTVDQVVRIVRAQRSLGTARLCPTLITAPIADTMHGLRTIAEACDAYPDVDAMVA